MLPPGESDAALIASVVPPGSALLELGAGAGRVTHCLVARGYAVVAVDESAEMLAHITGAETVVAGIEALDLARRSDAVLLASHLINVADDDTARGLLASCARHVSGNGAVLVERHAPSWFDEVQETDVERDGIRYRLSDISRTGPDLLTATVSYAAGERHWTQTFTARRVTDERMERMLADAGLIVDRYVDEKRTWVLARPS